MADGDAFVVHTPQTLHSLPANFKFARPYALGVSNRLGADIEEKQRATLAAGKDTYDESDFARYEIGGPENTLLFLDHSLVGPTTLIKIMRHASS